MDSKAWMKIASGNMKEACKLEGALALAKLLLAKKQMEIAESLLHKEIELAISHK